MLGQEPPTIILSPVPTPKFQTTAEKLPNHQTGNHDPIKLAPVSEQDDSFESSPKLLSYEDISNEPKLAAAIVPRDDKTGDPEVIPRNDEVDSRIDSTTIGHIEAKGEIDRRVLRLCAYIVKRSRESDMATFPGSKSIRDRASELSLAVMKSNPVRENYFNFIEGANRLERDFDELVRLSAYEKEHYPISEHEFDLNTTSSSSVSKRITTVVEKVVTAGKHAKICFTQTNDVTNFNHNDQISLEIRYDPSNQTMSIRVHEFFDFRNYKQPHAVAIRSAISDTLKLTGNRNLYTHDTGFKEFDDRYDQIKVGNVANFLTAALEAIEESPRIKR